MFFFLKNLYVLFEFLEKNSSSERKYILFRNGMKIVYFFTPLTSAFVLSANCERSEIFPPAPVSTLVGPPLA